MAPERPADGLNDIANGPLRPYIIAQLGFSEEGCAYRGTTYCLRCPWAKRIQVVCEYKCRKCQYKAACPCGHSSQTMRVESWFRLGAFGKERTMEDQNVGRLRRFEVRGKVYLRWYCDCPDCHSSHGQTFRVETTVLDRDEDLAVEKAVKSLGYEYDKIEWHEGPEVVEQPLGEDERMRMIDAPELLPG